MKYVIRAAVLGVVGYLVGEQTRRQQDILLAIHRNLGILQWSQQDRCAGYDQ